MGSKLAIKVTVAIVTDLANVTPVDESTAISNWRVKLNTPVSDTPIRAHFLGSLGSTFGPSSAMTIDEAKETLQAKKPGQAIYLSNVLDYIRRLNEGSSTQAPAGYVERSVLLGRLVVRGRM